ncbi:MAG TPA: LuxR C-terminal-related transcriptional regulator [Anaerolineales bacterium]|nr:LuxR C-terminal-related transcriptional regulator [Anaerolineales bacterium]
MSTPVLATKLYLPSPRPNVVSRPRLIERLNKGLQRKPGVTLISAPAGFGKTTLLSEWVNDLRLNSTQGSTIVNRKSKTLAPGAHLPRAQVPGSAGVQNRVIWLSLDEGDNDPARFLTYLITALQTVGVNLEAGLLGVLQSPQPPSAESILTTLLNEITTIPNDFILVLDDYHVIDAKPVDQALTFLLEHQPTQMHLVIATREDPNLPLARLRASAQLTELRAADLRFTLSEATEFLNQVMGLKLSTENITALETRTEGWIAGLQLAALSMQGQEDQASFIQSFTGSHHFVMDYLLEEVLKQQTDHIQAFLLRTSILDRMCGPLCDAILMDESASSQQTLEYLEHANLFIVPLDNERRWYRYHHLFADLLRQRLRHNVTSSKANAEHLMNELHVRASQWYEDNDLDIEAFRHAAAANDVERAERLIDGRGIPLHFRGAVTDVVNWLESLPTSVMNAKPSLWWRHAALLLVIGQTTGVEEKLNAAEAALTANVPETDADDQTRYWIGRIAGARAVLALTRYQADIMITQSRRALEYMPPDNKALRTTPFWTLGVAYLYKRDLAAAHQAFVESISLSQSARDIFTFILATIGLGNVQEAENQLHQAAETYRRVLQLAGDQPLQIIYEAHLGLAHIFYEWNNLDTSQKHAEQSLQLARQYDRVIDRFIVCEVFLARLKLALGDVESAAALLAQADQTARQKNFVYRLPEIAAAQVLVLLRQGKVEAAAQLSQAYDLPISQARVHLAQGNSSAALGLLEPLRQQMEAKRWPDELLKVMVLQALALRASGEKESAIQTLSEALALAEPRGFIRLFVDEGIPMAQLLSEASTRGMMPDYMSKLLAAFEAEKQNSANSSRFGTAQQTLIEPLSQRELEVLQLIARGLSNDEISKQLFLALDTVKGHNRRIYDKLQVQRRTEAVARARELGLL